MTRNTTNLTVAALAILWLTSLVAGYFVIHKPWPAGTPSAPLLAALDLVVVLAMASVTGGLGRSMLRSLTGLDRLERAAVASALGSGTVGLAVLAFGLAGLLHSWIAWVALLMGMVLLRRQVAGWWEDLASLLDGVWASGRLAKLVVVLAAGLGTVSLLEALAPPLKWDSLVYHLELPRQYIRLGRIGFVEGNLFVGFPQIGEMNFTWAMALRGGAAAATLGWVNGVIALLGVAGFARRLIGGRGGLMAMAGLLAGASLWQGLSWAYVDHWVVLFGLAMFSGLDLYARSRRVGWLIASGVCLGFAVGTKYSSGVLLPLGALVLLGAWLQGRRSAWQSAQSERTGDRVGRGQAPPGVLTKIYEPAYDIGRFVLIAGLVCLPWFVKNTLLTGNPIHPMVFPGREVDELRQAYQAQSPPRRGLEDDLLLPLQVTLLGIEGGPGYNTSIGPLLLAFAPGLFLSWRRLDEQARASLARLLVVAAAIWAIWAAGSHLADPLSRSRHYYGAFPVLAVLAAAGFEGLAEFRLPSLQVGWVLTGITALALALVGLEAVFHLAQTDPLPVLAGTQRTYDYLAERLGWYGWTMERINQLPIDSRVRFLWEPRAYYCEVGCQADVILDQWWYLRRTVGTASQIADSWRMDGTTHVLIYDFGARLEAETQPLITEDDWEELADLRENELQLVEDFGSAYSLYELRK